MENAVIYARYSSHNQTENSIEAQVAEARSYARRKNYTVVEVFADRAKTGTNDQRAEFQRMLKATEYNKFSVIIVWKVDRFGRNREEIALNKYRCKKNGVRVEYVAENISSGPEGVILESVLEGFAEYYSRQLSQNIRRGLKSKAKKGEFTGGRIPFGYKIVDGHYTIDETQAKKIKEVFKLFNLGYNYMDIDRKLGIPYYNVKLYLRNEIYCSETITRCGSEIHVPPIVTREEYNRAKDRYSHYTKRIKPDKYLLTGKLYCGFCGSKYKGCGNKDERYSYYRSTCHCCKKRIRRDDLDNYVKEKVLNIIKSPASIDELTDKVYEKIKRRVKNVNRSAEKESLSTRRKRLLNLVESGALPGDDPDLRERLKKLDAELMKLEVCCSGASTPIINREDIRHYIEGVKVLNNESAIISAFINRIDVMPDCSYKITFEAEKIFGTN